MKVFYIAGPYRADTPRKILENIRAAEAVAIEVWKAGHVALCPHLNSRLMDGICDDEVFLDGAVELMKRCDAVVLVPGWKKSKGALAEIEEARKLNMSIFSRVDGIDTSYLLQKNQCNCVEMVNERTRERPATDNAVRPYWICPEHGYKRI